MAIQLYNLEGEPMEVIPDGSPIPSGRWTSPSGGSNWQNGGYDSDHDEDGESDSGYTQPATVAPASGQRNEFGHLFVGRVNGRDVYRITDAAGVTKEWEVIAGDDSRAMIAGTLRNAGTPVATPPPPPPPSAPAVKAEPEHVYVGRNGNGNDVYRLTDEAGRVVQWEVAPNDDSRAAIPGTLRYGATPLAPAPAPVVTTPTGPATSQTPTTATNAGGYVPPQHILAGKDRAGNNVYRLTDEANRIVEWAVRPGDDSRNPIPGTLLYFNGTNSQVVAAVPVNSAPPGGFPLNPVPGSPAPGTVTTSAASNILPILGAIALAYLAS